MGRLIPEDLDVRTIDNAEERRVVETLRDGLTDSWLVLPNLRLATTYRDHELDVVLIHEEHGVFDLEVKGHRVEIRDGKWIDVANGRPLAPQPFGQARTNAYALRDLLRGRVRGLRHLDVGFGVAFPNTSDVVGDLPPEVAREQIVTAFELEDPIDAVLGLVGARTWGRRLSASEVEDVVATLLPDTDFAWDPAARMAHARRRLARACEDQTRALETLDLNRRVVAVGRAGTGKTRLAAAWTGRAVVGRDERTLLTCYNVPLADRLRERFAADERLSIGPFLSVALGLEGMPPIEVPSDADHRWWTVDAVGHLVSNWHLVTERFDTIIVDEAQDFSPAWLALLETLLDPDGPRRMLLVADENQELYPRGFHLPGADDGWTRCELVTNCRNAHEIAALLRRHLDGAASPIVGPEAVDVRWVGVPEGDVDAVVHAVGGELGRLLDDEERDPGALAVLTFASAVRDRLGDAHGLARWERRDEIGAVADGGTAPGLVENVHRVKGLEHDTVVLATATADVADDLLYVGVGRAVSELVLIAPEALARRLKLA